MTTPKTYANQPIDTSRELHGTTRKADINAAPPHVQEKVVDIIIEEGSKLRFDKRDIAYYLAIAKRESGFNPDAANTETTASGIAQMMAGTGTEFQINDRNRFDARASIHAGLSYFARIKALIVRQYGRADGVFEPMIYHCYHYGESSNLPLVPNPKVPGEKMRDRKNPIPIAKLSQSPKYLDSKTVVDEAARIEKVLTGTHALQIRLQDVWGSAWSKRRGFIVRKVPKAPAEQAAPGAAQPASKPAAAAPQPAAKPVPEVQQPAARPVAPESPQPPASSDMASGVTAPPGDGIMLKDPDLGALHPAAALPDQADVRQYDYLEPVEWEVTVEEVMTDEFGNIPLIVTESEEPFLLLIPREDYEEYGEAISSGAIQNDGNQHEVAPRGERAPPLAPLPAKKAIVVKPAAASPSPPSPKLKPVAPPAGALAAAQRPPLPQPAPQAKLTFQDAVAGLTKNGWINVYESMFSYVKQFQTRPKLPSTFFEHNKPLRGPAQARVQTVTSSVVKKEANPAKVSAKVKTAEIASLQIIDKNPGAPWMKFAVEEQRKDVLEIPASPWKTAEYKAEDARYNAANDEINKLRRAVKEERQKPKAKRDEGKIDTDLRAIDEATVRREKSLETMDEFVKPFSDPHIVKYHGATTLGRSGSDHSDRRSDNTSWCSSFANWCLLQAGYTGTRSAKANSWIEWGEELKVPRYGAITVVMRGANLFHVGFFIGIVKRPKEDGEEIIEINGKQKKKKKYKDVEYVMLLGGNQGKRGQITESAGWTVEKQVVTYRWPTENNKGL